MACITLHHQLAVFKKSMDAAMDFFALTKCFPKEVIYSLTSQIRRSSRSIFGKLAEAWRRRTYKAAFLNKLNECEAEAAETQVWLEFAVECDYIERETALPIYQKYDENLSMLVSIINHPEKWL